MTLDGAEETQGRQESVQTLPSLVHQPPHKATPEPSIGVLFLMGTTGDLLPSAVEMNKTKTQCPPKCI